MPKMHWQGKSTNFSIPIFYETAETEFMNSSKTTSELTILQRFERILQIDHGTFTPLVFSINSSMGRECQKFYSHLAQMISKKKGLPQSISSNWIRTKVCFGLLKSSREGPRTVCSKTAKFEIDVYVSHTVPKI